MSLPISPRLVSLSAALSLCVSVSLSPVSLSLALPFLCLSLSLRLPLPLLSVPCLSPDTMLHAECRDMNKVGSAQPSNSRPLEVLPSSISVCQLGVEH